MVIKVGDTVIEQDLLDYKGEEEIYTVRYEIPAEIVATAEVYELRDDTTGEVDKRDVLRISFSGVEGKESPKLHKNASTMTEYSHDAGIKNFTSNVGTVTKTSNGYQLAVPQGTQQVEIKTELADKFGLLYINNALTDDTRAKRITLSGEPLQ